jgi:branched-chain amino acid transport system permease protein
MGIRSKAIIGGLMIVALFALVPLVVQSDYFIGGLTVCFIYGIWTTNWDFMSGLTGRENFGHALFIGAGAYTAAFLDSAFSVNPWWGVVCTENLNPDVVMVKPAEDRV